MVCFQQCVRLGSGGGGCALGPMPKLGNYGQGDDSPPCPLSSCPALLILPPPICS